MRMIPRSQRPLSRGKKADVVEFDHSESCGGDDVKFKRTTQMLFFNFRELLTGSATTATSVFLVRFSPAEVSLFSLTVQSFAPVERWMGKAAEAA